MSLRLFRPGGGGLVSYLPDRRADWRDGLRSPRWNVASGGRSRLARLANPDPEAPSPVAGVLAFLALALATFVALMVLYALGVWTS